MPGMVFPMDQRYAPAIRSVCKTLPAVVVGLPGMLGDTLHSTLPSFHLFLGWGMIFTYWLT